MTTQLEFLDGVGGEGIAAPIDNYDGPIPAVADTIYLGFSARFRVVRRTFGFDPADAEGLTGFSREMKVSLHCERLPEGAFY
jgi:hypothetical protein